MNQVGYKPRLTVEEIEVRVWAAVILTIAAILFGSTFSFIFSVTFVQQPMVGMAPIDKVYTKMLNDIVLLCVGVLGGVAGRKFVGTVSQAIHKTQQRDDVVVRDVTPPKPKKAEEESPKAEQEVP